MTANRGRIAPILKKYGPLIVIVGLLAVVFRGWLSSGTVTYGDWGFYSGGRLQDFWPVPSLWDGSSGTGAFDVLAGPMFPLLFIQGFLHQWGIGFAWSERLVWIFPGVLIGALSTYALGLSFFSGRVAAVISALFLAFNSYIIVVMTGGQFTVSTGSNLMPLVLLLFYRALCRPQVGRLALTALAVAVQIMFDLRSTYLTLGVVILFALFYILGRLTWRAARSAVMAAVAQFVAMGVVGLLVHAYWLLPGHYAVRIALPGGYDSTDWVYRLSYMQLSHAFALFHPFWYQDTQTPHVGAVSPIFYALPLVILAVLLVRRATYVDLFLGVVALLSIFFIKGANPPAGWIYNWLFAHLPGFSMYRDPSKFYQPLALAYALLLGRAMILVPSAFGRRLRHRMDILVRTAVAIVGVGIAVLPTLPVAASAPWGTLAPVHIPAEYAAFNRFIDTQSQFFRVMWYPAGYQFATSSARHPSISAVTIGQAYLSQHLPTSTDATSWLLRPDAQAILDALSIKYIAVADIPAAGAQYAADRTQAMKLLRREFPSFSETRIGAIHLFVNRSYLPAAFVPAGRLSGSAQRALLQRAVAPPIERRDGLPGEFASACQACLTTVSTSQTRYEFVVHNAAHPFLLVLSQAFDPNWDVYLEPASSPQPFWWTWLHPARPERDHFTVNGFANGWWIDRPGTYRIVVEYWPQRLVDAGWIVCWLTIIGCLGLAAGPRLMSWLRHRVHREDAASEPVSRDGRPLVAVRLRQENASRDARMPTGRQ